MPDALKIEHDHMILAPTIESFRIRDSALNSLELQIELRS